MAKPIFVIYYPINDVFMDYQVQKINEDLTDYHVLHVMNSSISDIKFETFNITNATDIEIEELKAKVLNEISRSL